MEGLLIFSNAPDGALLATAVTDSVGVAVADVVDEGYVSAISLVETNFDWANYEILSVRVQPEMDTARLGLIGEGYDGPAREPMKLNIEWDHVDEAFFRVRASCGKSVDVYDAQSTVELADFTGCPGSDEFAVVVEALLPAPYVYKPMLFGYVDDLEYAPGGGLTVYVPLETSTEEATVFVAGATSPGKVTDVNQRRLPPGTSVGNCQSSCSVQELAEGGVQVTTPAPAFPELPTWSEFYRYGECTFTMFAQVSSDLAPIDVPVDRLARVISWPGSQGSREKTGGWQLLDGEFGDAIELSNGWPVDDSYLIWRMFDPIRKGEPVGEGVPTLELPTEVVEAVGSPPSDASFRFTGHLDVLEATDYPTFLELYDSDQFHTQESSAWTCD